MMNIRNGLLKSPAFLQRKYAFLRVEIYTFKTNRIGRTLILATFDDRKFSRRAVRLRLAPRVIVPK